MKALNRYLFISILWLCTAISLWSQNSMMWEVESPDGNKIFLLGSIHFADSTFYPLPNTYTEAFNSSDYLVTEIDLSSVNQFQLMNKLMYPLTDSLGAHISDTTMEKVVTYFKEKGISRGMVNRFRPAYVSMMVSTLESMNTGISPAFGIDMHFTKLAKERKMQILELETADSQVEVFALLNKEGNEETIVSSIFEKLGDMTDDTGKLIQAWKNGDTETLLSLISEMEDDIPENKDFYEALLHKRNHAMSDKIIEYLAHPAKKKHFVIVGAAHLLGDTGILHTLKEKKYKIKRY